MSPAANRNVFINCPFDEAYAPMLRAVAFAIVDCQFLPRCALENSDASEIRIQKIYQTIAQCQYGVHDISRTGLEKKTKFPRFNMPLELGIFLGAKFIGDENQRRKSCLVFDEHPNRYQMYLSDISGQDICWHSNDPKEAVSHIRNWLASIADTHIPTSGFIWDHYTTFGGELRHACSVLKQRPDELTYPDLLRHIRNFRETYFESLVVGTLDSPLHNPSAVDIKKSIRSVKPSDAKRDSYVILGKGSSGYTYIQAVREVDGKWVLEYQDGHLDEHYQADALLETEDIVSAFL
ncbi:MAG TPA: hypothetical protein VLQ45_17365, partial [Thermoanaerobaculia bacterium]|nr:hypothetical protein [Thermoanaerobaculia bacterium]